MKQYQIKEVSISNHSEKLGKTFSIKAIKLFILYTSAHVGPQCNSTQFLMSKTLTEQKKLNSKTDLGW